MQAAHRVYLDQDVLRNILQHLPWRDLRQAGFVSKALLFLVAQQMYTIVKLDHQFRLRRDVSALFV